MGTVEIVSTIYLQFANANHIGIKTELAFWNAIVISNLYIVFNLGGVLLLHLSERTVRLISKLFPENEVESIKDLLISKCNTHLPLCEGFTSGQMERIQFAAIKLSDGKYEELLNAVKLANMDWRDLLVSVGFANDHNCDVD